MGLDMWLPSVFDYADSDAVQGLFDSSSEVQAATAAGDPLALFDAGYDALRATGGYYREPYNALGLFPLPGLSWQSIWRSLGGLCGALTPEHARFVLAQIEQHSITPDVVERAVEITTNESQKNPQWMHQYLTGRRDGLIALLRKAIERDEPLMVSA
jgi:hypothetical protein